jgi:mono/diheme cytochrome c family protein
MLLKGERPSDSGGAPSALNPLMPYFLLGNMSDEDANAMVTYLRSLSPVEHRVKTRQAPWDVSEPAARFPHAKIPMPSADYPEHDAALRGRYLAGSFGVCLECHTPRDAQELPLVDKAFQGGRVFSRDSDRGRALGGERDDERHVDPQAARSGRRSSPERHPRTHVDARCEGADAAVCDRARG